MNPKILVWDTEVTPLLGYTYGMWNTNVLHVVEYPYIYAWSAKWHGDKKVIFRGIKDASEKTILKELHALLMEAAITLAHNGDNFDIKIANARFAFYGLPPLPESKTIDTLKILRRKFKLPSNSLDGACQYFGLERKKPSDQKGWLLEMKKKNPQVWRKIKEYNVQDVHILDQLYDRIKPYISNHPHFSPVRESCSNCANTKILTTRSYMTKQGYKTQGQCSCGAWRTIKSQANVPTPA